MKDGQPEISSVRETNENVLISVDTVGRTVVSSADQPIIIGRNEGSLLVMWWW